MSNLIRDASYAFRCMRRDPGFALATVTSLALGIAATTAIFSVANAVLLRSLPYRDPSRLAAISMGGAVTAPAFQAFQREAHSLEQAALFVNSSFNMTGSGGQPTRVEVARVSAGLFAMLGVNPRLGRAFSTEEDQPGRDNVVLVSHGLWRSEFGGDPRIAGRSVILDGSPHTIIGVMPPGFQFPYGPELPIWAGSLPPADMWRPMALADSERTCEGCYNFAMIARLRPGITPSQARAELIGILARRQPGRSRAASESFIVVTLQDALTRQTRAPIAILFGAVALALLIASVNVANLLLARGLRRQSEFALRLALGATPWQVARQLLTEACTLAICGAALAIPLTWAAMRAILVMAPAGIPRLNTIALDAPMLAFALGLSLMSALLFGVAPALLSARQAPGEGLKAGTRAASAGPLSLRAVLVAGELALSLVLLVGAGLLAKSFARVASTPLGFHAENVLTMRMSFSSGDKDDKDDAGRARLIQQLANNCAALPGATSAAAISTLPLTGESSGWEVIAENSPDPNGRIMVRGRSVTPAYFRTLGIRLLAGREFTDSDQSDRRVAILSATAARRLWPAIVDPAGAVSRRLAGKRPITVVGVVDDTRASGLDAEVRPYLYLPISERSAPDEFALAIRTSAGIPPASLAAAAKQEVWRLDKSLPVTHVSSMRQLVADSVAPRRFQAVLMTLFGAFALMLAAVGVYGVLAYSVTQRTREFGIRMALGATGRQVRAAVFRQTGALASCGIALGMAASLWLAPLMRGLLYGVAPWELSVLGGCALLLAVVAAAAGWIPARRAAKFDPMVCLRYE